MSADQNLSAQTKYIHKKTPATVPQSEQLVENFEWWIPSVHMFIILFHFFTPPLQCLCSPTFNGVLVVKNSEHAYADTCLGNYHPFLAMFSTAANQSLKASEDCCILQATVTDFCSQEQQEKILGFSFVFSLIKKTPTKWQHPHRVNID